jgi:hypothetical protein
VDELDGVLMLPRLRGDQPEQMQRIGIARLALQELAIDDLGLAQPPGLVMLETSFEQWIHG